MRQVLPKIRALPQFWMPPNVVRLHLAISQLRHSFPKLSIVFDGYDRPTRENPWNSQRFRLSD